MLNIYIQVWVWMEPLFESFLSALLYCVELPDCMFNIVLSILCLKIRYDLLCIIYFNFKVQSLLQSRSKRIGQRDLSFSSLNKHE